MPDYQLLLPKMGESVAEATVVKWLKNPGDTIEADEAILEIATDKVDSEVPSPVAGKLVQQLYKVDDVVQVGSPIAIIQTGEDKPEPVPAAIVQPPPETAQQAAPVQQPPVATPVQPISTAPVTFTPATKQPQPVIASAAPAPQQEPVKPAQVPFLDQLQNRPVQQAADTSETKTGRFYSPLVKSIAAREGIDINDLANIPGTGSEGRLTKDDLLIYLESKKSAPQQQVKEVQIKAPQPVAEAVEVPQPAPPREETAPKPPVVSQPVQQSAPTPVSETMEQPAAAPQAVQQPVPSASAPQPAPIPQQPVQPAVAAQQVPQPAPAANNQVQQPYIQPPVYQQQPPYVFYPQIIMPGAYPQGDANVAATQQQSAAANSKTENQPKAVSVGGEDEIIEMTRMRRLIADHMVNSKNVAPHVTSFIEVDVTNLVNWREKAKKIFEAREEAKLTFTPIFIEAVTYAIRALPMINVSVDGYNIIKRKNINIGMATALPSGNLIVPVIKKADELSLVGLAKTVNDLAERARKNKLQPDEVKDGTFTITNVGTFGNLMGTPIINQPQAAILAIGAIKKKPAVVETASGDVIAIRHMMFLSLSYDHRVVDGSLGGAFIKKVSDYLEAWDVNKEI